MQIRYNHVPYFVWTLFIFYRFQERPKLKKVKMKLHCDHSLIQITEKQYIEILKSCNLDLKCLECSTSILIEWCSKIPHIREAVPFIEKTLFIQRTLLLCKGSIELCKQKIDKILTARRLVPELLFNRTIEEFDDRKICTNVLFLPKLNPKDLTTVIVSQKTTNNLEDYSLQTSLRYMMMMAEYRIYYDFCVAVRIIIDLRNAPVSFLTKLNPLVIRRTLFLATECYGAKVKGVHILNASYFIDKLRLIIKPVLSQKMTERLHVHDNYEELHKYISKEILPADYGGNEKSCSDLSGAWKDLLDTEESRKMIDDLDKCVTDESKRLNSTFNDVYMGIPGSFKMLEID